MLQLLSDAISFLAVTVFTVVMAPVMMVETIMQNQSKNKK